MSNAGVWVKASTNPTKTDNYHVKITPNFITKEAPFNAACIFNSHGWQTPPGYKVLEWLDEQPIPVNQDEGYWQKRCEAAETLLEIVLDFPMTPGLGSSNKEEHRLAYNNWQQLKSSLSPTPVNDFDLENFVDWVILNYEPRINRKTREIMWNLDDADALYTTEEVIKDYKEHNPSTPVQEGLREDEYWKAEYKKRAFRRVIVI